MALAEGTEGRGPIPLLVNRNVPPPSRPIRQNLAKAQGPRVVPAEFHKRVMPWSGEYFNAPVRREGPPQPRTSNNIIRPGAVLDASQVVDKRYLFGVRLATERRWDRWYYDQNREQQARDEALRELEEAMARAREARLQADRIRLRGRERRMHFEGPLARPFRP